MAITLSNVQRHDGDDKGYIDIDRYPDSCPVCHHGIEPIKRQLAHFHAGQKRLEVIFRCPREKCQSLFIARYSASGYSNTLVYREAYPFEPVDTDFPGHIQKISPQFCAIANEAQKAEGLGWKLVAGPGYRKALEFLIKDYLCLAQPTDTDRIKHMQLGPCIGTFGQNEKVKATAARAAWLGNDETHYVRKWDDKDLDDLKTLIDLTVHWIEMEALKH